MVKVSVTWSIDIGLVQKISEEAKKSGKTVSFIANYHLQKTVKNQPSNQFFQCRICGEMRATTENGLCPDCLKIKQKAEKRRAETEFQKIENFQTEKKETEEQEKINAEEKERVEKADKLVDNLEIKRKKIKDMNFYGVNYIKGWTNDDLEKSMKETKAELKLIEKELQKIYKKTKK